LVGRHSRKSFQLGEKINVRVWRTNLERKQLDFRLAEQEKE
jgi:ribonuclease R